MTERECPAGSDHASLLDELRQHAGGALDLLEPLVERIRAAPRDPARQDPGEQPSCTACPVCAVVTTLRGGRSELAVRLADQVAGLLAVLRAALEEGAAPRRPTAPGDAPPAGDTTASEGPPPPGSARPSGLDGNRFLGGSRPPHVQRIEVSRERCARGGPHSLRDL